MYEVMYVQVIKDFLKMCNVFDNLSSINVNNKPASLVMSTLSFGLLM